MSSDTRNTRVMEERVVTADQQQWLDWIVRIQSLAQAGLHYGHDRFDLERYAELRDIAAKMMAAQSDLPLAKVRQLFCNEEGYQTPKIDTRAAIFQDGKLLLVHDGQMEPAGRLVRRRPVGCLEHHQGSQRRSRPRRRRRARHRHRRLA